MGNSPVSSTQESLDQLNNRLDTLEFFLLCNHILAFHPFGVGIRFRSIAHSFFLLYLLRSIVFRVLLVRTWNNLLFLDTFFVFPGKCTSQYLQPFQDSNQEIVLEGMYSKLLRVFHVQDITDDAQKTLTGLRLLLVPFHICLFIRQTWEQIQKKTESFLFSEVNPKEVREAWKLLQLADVLHPFFFSRSVTPFTNRFFNGLDHRFDSIVFLKILQDASDR